jgi:hypothetical protein
MKTYLLADYNWYDGVIQTSEEVTDNILDLLKDMCHPKFSHLKTTDEICEAEIKREGFIGYLEI